LQHRVVVQPFSSELAQKLGQVGLAGEARTKKRSSRNN